ncbi:helix-turn-helix domain-containing protein [Halopiger xanaduensis]|uniref:Bacterio-opsin activator HTH domain protein n=1 Tax=Halopiger xanaduensis (strain DSM 18323 / JCM 14033 / SH-6) TaxID=797210 RepID=F8DDY3_HALXS|nr:helix-turn-helix domain-containing protein [Halopiger xanaduensis]AEH39238.1 Bacterio-opsin activator HTH domain protein [Halopiger xanaduensis SH-6]
MGLIAEFRMTSEQLPLVDVAEGVPEATVEFESVQGHPSGAPTFIVRVAGADADAIKAAFADADSVTDHSLVVADGATRRYRCRPTGNPPTDLELLADNGSIPDRVLATPSGWEERRWFADREEFDQFRTFCRANDYELQLDRLVEADEGPDGRVTSPFGTGDRSRPREMTEAQQEALVTAHKMGYFDTPRTATMADVADELGVASASLSERLRRAQNHLIAEFRRSSSIKPRIN